MGVASDYNAGNVNVNITGCDVAFVGHSGLVVFNSADDNDGNPDHCDLDDDNDGAPDADDRFPFRDR